MQKLIGIIILAGLLFLLGACMSTTFSTISSELPAAARVILHPDPRVGDYAVQECVVKGVGNSIETGSTITTRQEITAIQPGRITVSMLTVIDTLPDNPSCYEYVLDDEGNTQEAFYIDNKTGNKTKLKITADETMGYTLQKWEEQVAIDGKDYTVYTFKANKKLNISEARESNVDAALIIFSLPDIPFLVVEAFNVSLIDSQVTYQIINGNWIETWRRFEQNIVTSHITLKEYGRGN